MEKEQKRALNQWLRAQSHLAKKWLYCSVGLALLAGLLLVLNAASLSQILHGLIIEKTPKAELVVWFSLLLVSVLLRAIVSYYKEKAAYRAGEMVRREIRHALLGKLHQMGSATIEQKSATLWANLLLDQVEDLQDFFARYLPQLAIAVLIPLIILLCVFPLNWAAGLILLLTAPLIPFFMALVGKGAADANRRNLKALNRLSGYFYDRLRGLHTIKLFDQVSHETVQLEEASNVFRQRTMEVLRLAFLSSAVLEFFTALSIALTAVYFGFSYLGELNFGHYGVGISLATGLFILLLAPEFYQPLRELGNFYHAKSQALAAAEAITDFLDKPLDDRPASAQQGQTLAADTPLTIEAKGLVVLSLDGQPLTKPLDFVIPANQRVAILGASGAGKTSLLKALLGHLPYQGSLRIGGVELACLSLTAWRRNISWVGQNPNLFHGSIAENIALAKPDASQAELTLVAEQAHALEFIQQKDQGFAYPISDHSRSLSVGQAQRIALARALLQQGGCWLLDEPTASLDRHSAKLILASLVQATEHKTTVWITHDTTQLPLFSQVLLLEKGQIRYQGDSQGLAQQAAFIDLANQQSEQANA